ncbi:MAG: hypothetical protein WCF66_08920, partial [Pseudolabrys sp.]
SDVRFTPKSGHSPPKLKCPLSAMNGHHTNQASNLIDFFDLKQGTDLASGLFAFRFTHGLRGRRRRAGNIAPLASYRDKSCRRIAWAGGCLS